MKRCVSSLKKTPGLQRALSQEIHTATNSSPKLKQPSSSHKINNGLINYLRFHDSDEGAWGVFFEACRPFIASRYHSYKLRFPYLDEEELKQQMNLIAIEAIKVYKPAKGKFNFFGHLNLRIWQRMRRYLCAHARSIRIPETKAEELYFRDHYLDAQYSS